MTSHAQLVALGVSRHTIQRGLRTGTLAAIHPGVYLHAAVPTSREALLLAAILAGGNGTVAARRSAAALHGLRAIPWSRPEILTPAADKPLLDGVHVHRTRRLDAVDTCLVGGIPATAVGRTLLDLGALLPFETVELAAQDAIIRNLVRVEDLAAVLERVGRRGRPGTATLRAIVSQSLPDERLQSELERLLHDLIKRAPVEAPELQHHVVLPNGRDAYLDFAWPRTMTAAEADGRRWHATRRDHEAGLVRRRQLQQLGWDVRYYGWADIVERSLVVIDELCDLPIVLRRPEPGTAA